MDLQPQGVVTTQRTSKRFKLMLLVGYLAIALSACPAVVGWLAVENQQLATRLVVASFVVLCASLAWIAAVKGFIWWYHE